MRIEKARAKYSNISEKPCIRNLDTRFNDKNVRGGR